MCSERPGEKIIFFRQIDEKKNALMYSFINLSRDSNNNNA